LSNSDPAYVKGSPFTVVFSEGSRSSTNGYSPSGIFPRTRVYPSLRTEGRLFAAELLSPRIVWEGAHSRDSDPADLRSPNLFCFARPRFAFFSIEIVECRGSFLFSIKGSFPGSCPFVRSLFFQVAHCPPFELDSSRQMLRRRLMTRGSQRWGEVFFP